jgi:hypothetical protein
MTRQTAISPPTWLWDVTAEVRPLAGGHRNLAFRTIGLSQDVVFKSTRRPDAGLRWLLRVQDVARHSGFVVPKMMPSRRGALVEDGWTCETFVAGAALAAPEMPEILPLIRRFHDLAAKTVQRPGFRSSRSLLRTQAGGDVDLGAMPPALVQTCRVAWRAIAEGPQSVVHSDLNPGNLLRCPDGRIALLDWDECRRDLVVFDLGQLRAPDPVEARALLAWEVACSWRIEPDHARRLAQRL